MVSGGVRPQKKLWNRLAESYIRKNFDCRVKAKSPEIQIPCPYHAGDVDYRFSFNVVKEIGHCWSCETAKTWVQFYADSEGIAPAEARKRLLALSRGEEVEDDDAVRTFDAEALLSALKPGQVVTGDSELLLPPEARLLEDYLTRPSLTSKMSVDYILSRISVDQITKHEMYWCSAGRYAGRILVPLREDGRLVYFATRAIAPAVQPKYKNPPVSKGSSLFNWSSAKSLDYVVLVEGIFDALGVGDHGVAILGKDLNESQLSRLALHRPKKTFIMLDPGAMGDAVKLSKQLSEVGIDALVAELRGFKDPGEATQEALNEALSRAGRVGWGDAVRRRLRNV